MSEPREACRSAARARSQAEYRFVSDDIWPILQRWPWDPNGTVRRVVGDDGRERVQIRLYMNGCHGLLQFECDGRPDGESPYGGEYALEYYERQGAADPGLRLNKQQAKELIDEGTSVYHRYVVMFQMGDFTRVVRDTERNMRLFRFMRQYARREEDRSHLERWWPYIIRIHGTARAMLCLAEGNLDQAGQCVREAVEQIRGLEEMDDETFVFERKRSLEVLTELTGQIDEQRPRTRVEELERLKDRAIRQENYELAARLRDRINRLKAGGAGDTPEGEPGGPAQESDG